MKILRAAASIAADFFYLVIFFVTYNYNGTQMDTSFYVWFISDRLRLRKKTLQTFIIFKITPLFLYFHVFLSISGL